MPVIRLGLTVCQLSGPAKPPNDALRCSLSGGIDLLLFCPICYKCAECPVDPEKREQRVQTERGGGFVEGGDSATQLPQSTKTDIAAVKKKKKSFKWTNAHTRHTHKHDTSKWRPLVHEYPIA